MQLTDDRTPIQRTTHPVLIGGTDRFLSYWGGAENGPSYAFWACRPAHECTIRQWVQSRSDIIRYREVSPDYRPPSGPGHCHIYVVTENHPALKEPNKCAQ
jgi:hypothetical protein